MNKIFSTALLITLLAISNSAMATPFCDAFYAPLPCPNDDPDDPDDPIDQLTELNALDDENAVVKNTTLSASGNVLSNDLGLLNFDQVTVKLDNSPSSSLGNLLFKSDGSYTYELSNDAPQVQALQQGQFITDVFTYSLTASTGETASATLTITILGTNAEVEDITFVAIDDESTVVKNILLTTSGNVAVNDIGPTGSQFVVTEGFHIKLTSSPSSNLGNLIFNSFGSYTYQLFNDSPAVQDLDRTEFLKDIYTYEIVGPNGGTSSATLTITILGSSIITTDNVEIEKNDSPDRATPLHLGQNIQGHFLSPADRDWYAIPTLGNEIVHFEICPEDSSCFNEKDWVVLVIDSEILASQPEFTFLLKEWDKETKEVVGTSLVHDLCVKYQGFNNPDNPIAELLGVIDLNFGDTNSLNIGVGEGPNTLLALICPPLLTDADSNFIFVKDSTEVVVKDGVPTVIDTEAEFYEVIYNDDQYAIKVTGTGVNPLLAKSSKAATFEAGRVYVPFLTINNESYKAVFKLGKENTQTRSADPDMSLIVEALIPLDLELTGDPYQSTYNPENDMVFIPQVVDSNTNIIYSVTMLYHHGENGNLGWLEVLKIEEVI